MLETKPVAISPLSTDDQAELERIVDRVADLAAQQRAGFPVGADELSPLEFELVVLWQSAVEACERAHQQRVAAIVEGMAGQ